MELKDNPILQQEDYLAGYDESIEALKNKPQLVSLDKLCYEVFVGTEAGKKLMEHFLENYLIPPLADRNAPDYPMKAVWGEGFKDFIRMLRMAVKSHEQRIQAGAST